MIAFGFDGSRRREHAPTDATALIGCVVETGHLFVPFDGSTIWEPPAGEGKGWEVPADQVDAAVRALVDSYDVVALYAETPQWETHIAAWTAEFGHELPHKLSPAAPIAFPTSKTQRAIDALRTAIVNGECTFDGNPALRRHMLNARVFQKRGRLVVNKPHPASHEKIDAAVAASLAWQARLDVLASPPPPAEKSTGELW